MLQIQDIRKEYNTGGLVQKALDGVSLNFRDNEFVAILGPSGSGKTTLLNIIGGLDRYDSGDLIINGVSTKQYKDRDWDSYRNHTIGFVFQSYNLIPHQTVLANVELALTISGISRSERRQRAQEALEKVGLGDQTHKIPSQMSGGQMQRVAIARALVNDPDILLADEPTGALDSDTSVQVMDLLKEVAKDRLVVMVTHNPELAEEYATRIVKLKDGHILADSDPFLPDAESEYAEPVHENMGKSSMSFFTALQLSFNNLLTKKARTILVAFAGSIGIIGIALILSMSNGANKYIADIEENTLSEYPIDITSTGFSLASMMGMGGETEEDDSDTVKEIKTITSMLSKISSNDLASLKKFLQSGESDVDVYAKHIMYKYNVLPQVYQANGDKVKQVNPYSVMTALDNGASSMYSSFSSFSISMTELFHEMPDNDALYKNQYEVMAGHWPENYNECVLVLTDHNYVSDLALFAMGLLDDSKLDAAIKDYMAGGELAMEDDEPDATFAYDDFLNVKFKLINAGDCYTYDSKYKVWTSKKDNEAYMKKLVEDGEDLVMVGVVRPSEDSNSAMLTTGINYPYSLTEHIIDRAAESKIVQAQLKDSKKDVLTGKPFGQKPDNSMDLSKLFSIDEDAIQKAFQFDTASFDLSSLASGMDLPKDANLGDLASAFSMDDFNFDDLSLDDLPLEDISLEDLFKNMDLKDLNLTDFLSPEQISSALPDIKTSDLTDLLKKIKVNIGRQDIEKTIRALTEGYQKANANNPQADLSKLSDAITSYLTGSQARQIITDGLRKIMSDIGTDLITQEDLQAISNSIAAGYSAWAETQEIPDPENYAEHLTAYLRSDAVRQILDNSLTDILRRAADRINQEDLAKIATDLASGYDTYAKDNTLPDAESITKAFGEYLQSDEAGNILSENLLSKVDTSELEKELNQSIAALTSSYSKQIESTLSGMVSSFSGEIQKALTKQISSFATSMSKMIGKAISSQLSGAMEKISSAISLSMMNYMGSAMESFMGGLSSKFSSAFSMDAEAFKNAVSMNMDEQELRELMMSMMSTDTASYDSNLKEFGYADYKKPYDILIYPKDFESKDEISAILESYNERMRTSGQEDKVITYTDLVGTLMSSVTTIINAISYILIAFVSISLIVSSIMIGVITYISVLERRKEIGILRSIGASKRNISNVFNAETFITGLLAGILGTGITLLLLIPGNAILRAATGQQNLAAYLPLSSAGLLIILSVILTLIGGLIPSRKAAKSDPVTALRNE